VAKIIDLKAHLTVEGLNEIKLIRLGGNKSEERNLVLYGSNLSSTVGSPKFTLVERSLIKIPISKMSVFIGIILSDASIQKQNKKGDARLQFKQKYGQF